MRQIRKGIANGMWYCTRASVTASNWLKRKLANKRAGAGKLVGRRTNDKQQNSRGKSATAGGSTRDVVLESCAARRRVVQRVVPAGTAHGLVGAGLRRAAWLGCLGVPGASPCTPVVPTAAPQPSYGCWHAREGAHLLSVRTAPGFGWVGPQKSCITHQTC